MKKLVLIYIVILTSGIFVYAQDTLYMNNNQKIISHIKEIDLNEIKYDLNGITIGIDKSDVDHIVFQNGSLMNFSKGSLSTDTIYTRNNQKLSCQIKEIGTFEIKYEFNGILARIAKSDVDRIVFKNGSSLNNEQTYYSTDTIYSNDNQKIICHVQEIDLDEIKYDYKGIPNSISKSDIDHIVSKNGAFYNLTRAYIDSITYKEQKRSIISYTFFSYLFGYTGISYDYVMSPGSILHITLGIIGAGNNNLNNNNATGVSLKLGYKFMWSPSEFESGYRYYKVLEGMYLEPEINISYYNYNSTNTNLNYPNNTTTSTNNSNSSFSIMLVHGHHFVIKNTLVIDGYVGFGIGSNSNNPLNYGYLYFGNSFPLTFTTGIRIGFAL